MGKSGITQVPVKKKGFLGEKGASEEDFAAGKYAFSTQVARGVQVGAPGGGSYAAGTRDLPRPELEWWWWRAWG